MRFLKRILSAFIAALLVTNAYAQEANKKIQPPDEKLDLVTLTKPKVREHCRVVASDLEKTVCKQPFGKTKTYLRCDLAAIIDPRGTPKWQEVASFPIPFAREGAVIYGAVVVGSVAATAGLSVLAFLMCPLFFILMDALIHPGDKPHDIVVYHDPTSPLAVKLN